MFNKKQARLRRARKTRAKIAELKAVRLCVNRTNCHIYAQIISPMAARFWLRLPRWTRTFVATVRTAATRLLPLLSAS